MNIFKNKNVLVTGHSGMIGCELEILLKELGCNFFGADIKQNIDLRFLDECMKITENMDYAFLLHGIKGSPKKTQERPLDFFTPIVLTNTNMIESCRLNRVKRVLYTSSIAVENQESDKYPAIAKILGEQQISATRIQYPDCETRYCIVRPCNVYGKESYKGSDSMVITSLIHKALNNDILEVWGDGSQERDFIHAKDAARGMIKCIEAMPTIPINLCSGVGIQIKKVAEIIAEKLNKTLRFDTTKPTGAQSRVMRFDGNLIDWESKISIEDGINEILEHLHDSRKNKS